MTPLEAGVRQNQQSGLIDYSIIVPAYNAADVLPRCLAALMRQTVDRSRYEIIVIDDGSTDATVTVAEQTGVNVIRAAHGGPAAARNAGARVARGHLLIFTDADCGPAPDWIARMASPFVDSQIAGAKGVYRTRQASLVARFVQQEYQDKYDHMARHASIDFVDTYSAAYRRDVFLGSGGFDPAFIMDEDQELSFRLAAKGHRLVFVPDAIVYHTHVAAPLKYVRRKFGVGYWKALILRRHPHKVVRDSHTPQILKVQIGLLTVATVSLAAWGLAGWMPNLAVVGWLLLFVTMLPMLIKIARRDPAVLVIAPVMIVLRALSLGLGLAVGLVRFRRYPALPVAPSLRS